MKTFLGYASIALAVLGLAGYVLRPAARTMPWYKFIGAMGGLLAMGIGLIAIDAEKETKTASAPVKSAMEAHAAPSGDKELLARVVHDWKDAYGRREAAVDMWINLLKANFEKRELDAARTSTLDTLVAQHKEQCDLFTKLQSDIQRIGNKGAQQNAQTAMALSAERCKDVREWMVATMAAISPDVLKATGRNVGYGVNTAMQVHLSQLSGSKEREGKTLQHFTSALTALGMSTDLKSY